MKSLLIPFASASIGIFLPAAAYAFNFARHDVVDNIPYTNPGNTFFPALSQIDSNSYVWQSLDWQYINAPLDIVPGTYDYFEAKVGVKDIGPVYPFELYLREFWEKVQLYPLPTLNIFTAPDGKLSRLKFSGPWDGTVAIMSYHPCFFNSYNSLLLRTSLAGTGDNYVSDVTKSTCGNPSEVYEVFGSIPPNTYASIAPRIGTGASMAFSIRSDTLPPSSVGEAVGEQVGVIQLYEERYQQLLNYSTRQFGPLEYTKFVDAPGQSGNFNPRPRTSLEDGIRYEQLALPLWRNYYLSRNPVSTPPYPKTRLAYFDHPTQGSFSRENLGNIDVSIYTFPVRVRDVFDVVQSCNPACTNQTRTIREYEVFQGFKWGYYQTIYKTGRQTYDEDDLFPMESPIAGLPKGTPSSGTCSVGYVPAPWSTPTTVYCIPGQTPAASAIDINPSVIQDGMESKAVPEPTTILATLIAAAAIKVARRNIAN